MTQIKPMWEYLLVEPIQEETTTASGIVLPDNGKEKPWCGKVIAKWPGKTTDDWQKITLEDISIWDEIYFPKYSTEEVEVENNKYILVKYSSVFAKK